MGYYVGMGIKSKGETAKKGDCRAAPSASLRAKGFFAMTRNDWIPAFAGMTTMGGNRVLLSFSAFFSGFCVGCGQNVLVRIKYLKKMELLGFFFVLLGIALIRLCRQNTRVKMCLVMRKNAFLSFFGYLQAR